MIPAKPECPSCHYDLTGIVHEHETIACPECGTTFDPGNPFALEAWPSVVKIALIMTLPTAVAFIVNSSVGTFVWDDALSGSAQLDELAVWGARIFLLGAWIAWPGAVAHRLVRRCAHPSERGILWMMLTLAGVGLGAMVMLALGFLMLLG